MNKFFLGVIVIISIVIIAGSYVVLRAKTPLAVSVTKYSTNDHQKPKVEIDRTSYDLKSIKVSDTASAKFTVKNTGNKPLQLFDISSSCGCPGGQEVYISTNDPENPKLVLQVKAQVK